MKFWWILVLLGILLLVSSFRERFETSQCPSGFVEDRRFEEGTQNAYLRCKKETGQPTCPAGYTMTPFVKMAEGAFNGGTCEKGGESTVARCEGLSMLNVLNDKQVCVEYEFVPLTTPATSSSTSGGAVPDPLCPSGFTLDGNKCKSIAETEPINGYCPADGGTFVIPNANGKCNTRVSPICGAGYTFTTAFNRNTGGSSGKCEAIGSVPPPQSTVETTAETTPASQSSTGGSSTSSFGPNSGGSTGGNRRNQVFGPGSGGRGESSVSPMDSSKTSQYPEIMGGGDNKASTRIDGGGIVAPSKNWQLANDGSLPNCTSLGCNENSKYFPFSRQPGDMDLIPDPYRVSQQFSSASYSFKTEPTPFLTDFSAFQR